jgi:hypothetical protein
MTPFWLAPEHQSLPPILHKQDQNSIPECSKGSGVFSSWCGKTASSPPLRFHRVSPRDSAQFVTPFVRVGTYPTRNFALLTSLCFQRSRTISSAPSIHCARNLLNFFNAFGIQMRLIIHQLNNFSKFNKVHIFLRPQRMLFEEGDNLIL